MFCIKNSRISIKIWIKLENKEIKDEKVIFLLGYVVFHNLQYSLLHNNYCRTRIYCLNVLSLIFIHKNIKNIQKSFPNLILTI